MNSNAAAKDREHRMTLVSAQRCIQVDILDLLTKAHSLLDPVYLLEVDFRVQFEDAVADEVPHCFVEAVLLVKDFTILPDDAHVSTAVQLDLVEKDTVSVQREVIKAGRNHDTRVYELGGMDELA